MYNMQNNRIMDALKSCQIVHLDVKLDNKGNKLTIKLCINTYMAGVTCTNIYTRWNNVIDIGPN